MNCSKSHAKQSAEFHQCQSFPRTNHRSDTSSHGLRLWDFICYDVVRNKAALRNPGTKHTPLPWPTELLSICRWKTKDQIRCHIDACLRNVLESRSASSFIQHRRAWSSSGLCCIGKGETDSFPVSFPYWILLISQSTYCQHWSCLPIFSCNGSIGVCFLLPCWPGDNSKVTLSYPSARSRMAVGSWIWVTQTLRTARPLAILCQVWLRRALGAELTLTQSPLCLPETVLERI